MKDILRSVSRKKYREEGYNLANLSDGGSGIVVTDMPWFLEILSKARQDVKFTDEYKKLSIVRKKRKITDETRLKMHKSSKRKNKY